MSFGSVLASPCHDYFFHSTSNESAAAIYNCTGDYYAASAGYAPSPTTLDHYPNIKPACTQSLRAADGELTNWSCNYDTGYNQPFEPSLYQPLKAPNKGRLNSVQGAGMMFCGKPRVVKRRVSANKKERRRTLSINSAFSNLRERIPFIPQDTKLSKIKTLRLATSYIAYLIDFLDAHENQKDIPNDGFKNVVTKTLETRERRKRELLKAAAIQTTKPVCKDFNPMRNVNRTGWPQHVWATELDLNIHSHNTAGGTSPFMEMPLQNQN